MIHVALCIMPTINSRSLLGCIYICKLMGQWCLPVEVYVTCHLHRMGCQAFHQLPICNDGLATPSTVLCSKAASAEWVAWLHGGVCWSAVDLHLQVLYMGNGIHVFLGHYAWQGGMDDSELPCPLPTAYFNTQYIILQMVLGWKWKWLVCIGHHLEELHRP